MDVTNQMPDESISLFVKNIIVLDEPDTNKLSVLPFFADGYPGLMFQSTQNGLKIRPHNKQMPLFFLYGQTIHPIELVIDGVFQLIVFQLYPFVLKNFFNVQPKDLNDDCYDVASVENKNINEIITLLQSITSTAEKIGIISSFLLDTFIQKSDLLDFKVRQAIQIIVDNRGLVTIKELSEQLKINERTLERRFVAQAGISPKQLATIVQFDASLNQLTEKDYNKLTDIVYTNGFADQSHFIRVFKAFTGITPKKFGAKK